MHARKLCKDTNRQSGLAASAGSERRPKAVANKLCANSTYGPARPQDHK
eukprot:CAMPEP_0177505968 /NCGR_PEP_ID=MMETSP0369-20130122/39695_1 /TAXON_ID=447022 ORGANISM="Scrippsiella hangoei-like, Strain SHHI-4" /NCGR_SAMPLE_ID=MMETSP0369 /ASSEMBLY_ACC=CAM_ASM_000364 /LENGTH=48 /DNA_ID= /DNA_START= /DNA_END= /DNA_ORIENTATION=